MECRRRRASHRSGGSESVTEMERTDPTPYSVLPSLAFQPTSQEAAAAARMIHLQRRETTSCDLRFTSFYFSSLFSVSGVSYASLASPSVSVLAQVCASGSRRSGYTPARPPTPHSSSPCSPDYLSIYSSSQPPLSSLLLTKRSSAF